MQKNNGKRRLSNPLVKKFLTRYLPIIKETYHPSQVWLFGSYAHGKPGEWSDLDVAIVSRKFAQGRIIKRRSSFLRETGLWHDEEIVVDPLCYTSGEFQRGRKMPTIIQEIVETGIRIV